ncbi:hypothetical protein EDD11_007595 [Mortierella claussenii]|nr:hypothetical protein EDD11_007595 [Mortierella claussenii]
MAISIDFSMFDTTNAKLSKSADALESALAHFGKNSCSTNIASDLLTPSATTGSGFDEWLATDLSFGAFSGDESSSSSPFSALEDSPVLGFDSFGSSVGPSLFDMSIGFSADVASSPVEIKSPQLPMLTTSAVQQAAAALNIPWSAELESAVMAQAAAVAIPTPQAMASPLLLPKTEPEEACLLTAAPSPIMSSRATSASPVTATSTAATPAPKVRGSKKRQLTTEQEAEEIIAKRAKNTDAARRSRLKKLIKLEGLELKISDLEAANSSLTMKIAILETEKSGFLAKDAEQAARIAQLEAQLAEAHAALTSRA